MAARSAARKSSSVSSRSNKIVCILLPHHKAAVDAQHLPGAGRLFLPAAVGSAAVFIVMLVLGRIRNDVRTLVVVRARRSQELAIEGLIFSYLGARAQQRVKNTTQDSVELMYEMTRGALDAAQRKQEQPLTDALYALGGVDYVNIVAQSDEIGS